MILEQVLKRVFHIKGRFIAQLWYPVSSDVDPGIPDHFLIISSSLDHVSGRN